MESIYSKISEELDIPKGRVRHICEDYFSQIKDEMRNPSAPKIVMPLFGKFEINKKKVTGSIRNMIKVQKQRRTNKGIIALRKLWKIRQMLLKYNKNEK